MRRIGRYLALIFLAITVSSCATYDSATYGTASSAYSSYRRVKRDVTPSTVVAMMAYASAAYSRSDARTWAKARAIFNYIALDMESNGTVSTNYPIKPTASEIALFKKITTKWVDKMESSRLSARDGSKYFTATAAEFIVRIQNDEYSVPSI